RAIAFYENEAIGMFAVLQHIESCDSRLLQTLARVVQGGRLERLDRLRFDPHVNENEVHDRASTSPGVDYARARGARGLTTTAFQLTTMQFMMLTLLVLLE